MKFAAVVSVPLLLAACASVGEPAVPLLEDIEGIRDGQVHLNVGETVSISLPSNVTTGYAWQVTVGDGGVLTPAAPFGQEVVHPHAPGMVGVGGVTRWRFTAARPGTATLAFAYRRAWERDAPPAEMATYRVTVR